LIVPRRISDKRELFALLANRLEFPSYFGQNWDALDEMLRDLSWLQETEVIFWHDDIPFENNKSEQQPYFRVLMSAISEPKSDRSLTVRAIFPEAEHPRLRSILEALD